MRLWRVRWVEVVRTRQLRKKPFLPERLVHVAVRGDGVANVEVQEPYIVSAPSLDREIVDTKVG